MPDIAESTNVGAPTCPRDGVVLVNGALESISFHKCPTCHGVSVSAHHLTELLEKMIGRLKKNPGRFRLAPSVPDHGKKAACPNCGVEMKNGPYGRSSVVVDWCETCETLWLDTFELGAICVHHAKKHHDLSLSSVPAGADPAENFVAWWLMVHFIPLDIDLGI